nr:MAG TPA: hypothetical protein [Caudoviricetes sp.]
MKPPVLQHRRLLKMTENQDEVIFWRSTYIIPPKCKNFKMGGEI